LDLPTVRAPPLFRLGLVALASIVDALVAVKRNKRFFRFFSLASADAALDYWTREAELVLQAVHVVLFGFDNDGAIPYSLREKSLERQLSAAFPSHRPAFVASGEELLFRVTFSYTVRADAQGASRRGGTLTRAAQRGNRSTNSEHAIARRWRESCRASRPSSTDAQYALSVCEWRTDFGLTVLDQASQTGRNGTQSTDSRGGRSVEEVGEELLMLPVTGPLQEFLDQYGRSLGAGSVRAALRTSRRCFSCLYHCIVLTVRTEQTAVESAFVVFLLNPRRSLICTCPR
jgi:hypothetical protein